LGERILDSKANSSRRSAAPVFVLGSPRSGTTLLYNMLLSSGGFAVYLAESNAFNLLAQHFGDLGRREARQKLLQVWLGSKLFRASGLNAGQIENEVMERCRNIGDFLRIVMGEIARAQGMQRWAENSPEGILHLPLIKRLIPDALVIHIIRDGRDVAMSLSNVRYLRPFPWQDRVTLTGAGIYWEWIVQQGRSYGRPLGPDYMEVHFEDLVAAPRETLKAIGMFIDQELDHDRIREVAYGSVSKPNTSFGSEPRESFNPVGRWKNGFFPEQLLRFERIVGKTLTELGYATATDATQRGMNMEMRLTRWMYRTYFEGKLGLKGHPLVRRLRPLTAAHIDAMAHAEDHPPELKKTVSSQSPGSSR
jgi:sulfotransferase family protein